jgi:hypothetical protein
LGVAPFNLFIIVNKIREKEHHLPYRNTTALWYNFFDIGVVHRD